MSFSYSRPADSSATSHFERAPGGNGPPSSSTYYTAPEHLSHGSRSSSSLSALGFAPDHGSDLGSFSPNLGGSGFDAPQVRTVDSRAYPLVERRSFRDVSSAGDVVVGGYEGGAGTGTGSGSGATSREIGRASCRERVS